VFKLGDYTPPGGSKKPPKAVKKRDQHAPGKSSRIRPKKRGQEQG